ncbi:MAG: tetratricopeptide repeat protein [Planctomycetota bacterium]|nr:tetratricopeptide repeat protein [Planctomycetota bacterium]
MKNPMEACAWLIAATLLAGGCKMTETNDTQPTTQESADALPEWRPMWNFGDPAGTEAKFRKALEAGAAAGDKEYVQIVTTQLARTQGLQRKFEEAHAILDGMQGELSQASTEVNMRYLLERGRAKNSSGDSAGSTEQFEAAWNLGQGANLDGLTADAGHMMAIALQGDAALEWSRRTMDFCEASPDKRCKGWLGPLYNNTGWTLHDQGDLDGALELWQKSLAFREAEGNAETIFISRWTIARCYRSMGRLDEALADQRQLHKDRAAADNPGAGYIEEELGECLLALGKPEEAAPWFAKAFEMLSKDDWLVANEADRLARLKDLGSK